MEGTTPQKTYFRFFGKIRGEAPRQKTRLGLFFLSFTCGAKSFKFVCPLVWLGSIGNLGPLLFLFWVVEVVVGFS